MHFARPFLGEEEAQAAADVIRSGWIVGGPRLREFETSAAQFVGAKAAAGVSSWTTGAFLALHALGVGPCDEIIVPSLTFIASVNVIRHAGATPVFVDVDRQTYNLLPSAVEAAVTPRTRGILAVDQIGLPCAIDEINAIAKRHGLFVLDDAACGLGSLNNGRQVGGLADVTVFSLHARKVVTCGEGGLIVSNDEELVERIKRLRHQGMSISDFQRHGMKPSVVETYDEIGYNARLTDIQAAVALVQLSRLEEMLANRRRVAERYNSYLSSSELFEAPFVPAGLEPNWQSYQIVLMEGGPERRKRIIDALHERGVPTRRGVMASHREVPYRELAAELSNTEFLADHSIQLPMHAGLSHQDLDQVIDGLGSIGQLGL